MEYDGLVVNISNYTVTLEGHNLEMPPKELEILYFLASRPNQVFTREQLLDKLVDTSMWATRGPWMYISRDFGRS